VERPKALTSTPRSRSPEGLCHQVGSHLLGRLGRDEEKEAPGDRCTSLIHDAGAKSPSFRGESRGHPTSSAGAVPAASAMVQSSQGRSARSVLRLGCLKNSGKQQDRKRVPRPQQPFESIADPLPGGETKRPLARRRLVLTSLGGWKWTWFPTPASDWLHCDWKAGHQGGDDFNRHPTSTAGRARNAAKRLRGCLIASQSKNPQLAISQIS